MSNNLTGRNARFMKRLMRIFRRSAAPAEAVPEQSRKDLMNGTMLDSKHMTLRQTLKAAWSLTKPYFSDPTQRKAAFSMLAVIGAAMVADVGALNWLNNINGQLW